MDSKFIIGEEKSEEELKKKDEIVFGKAEEVGIRKVDSDKYRKIYKMLSNIVVFRKKLEDLSNTFNVYSHNPSEEDYKKLIDFLRKKIKTGELRGTVYPPTIYEFFWQDEVNWYGDFDKEKVKKLIGEEEGDYFFSIDEGKNVLFGDVEDLPKGLRKTVGDKSVYWKKLNKSLALVERDCVDEDTFETTKCYKIIAKKRIKTEDLEDVLKILKSKKAIKFTVDEAKSEKDILEEKLPI
ncbi:MAG: hypothetical protein QW038_02475 [Nanopusillaceae archaeon]